MSVSAIVSIVAGLVGAIGWAAKWLYNNQQKRAGAVEAALQAANRDAERARQAAQIDTRVRQEHPNALEKELNG